MKAIHYDTEGDILSVTFTELEEQSHTGVELTENIVLYYNPETREPLKLIVLSYRALVEASTQAPLLLEGVTRAPAAVQSAVMSMLQRAPLTTFFRMTERTERPSPVGQIRNIFAPAMLQTGLSFAG